MEVDIYGMDKRINYFVKRLERTNVPEENKKAILNFFDYQTASGISKSRILIYANRLIPLADMFGQIKFKEAKKEDIQRIVADIERKDWSSETKTLYRVTIKRFYKWLLGNDEAYPEPVRWLKTQSGKKKRILPEELLTGEDVQKLIDACENPRDKAFISVLYESGCRIGEIAGMQIKHISFDEYGAQIAVNGKTGPRRVRLLQSIHFLRYWLELHPFKNVPENPLWAKYTNNKGKNMCYQGILKIISNAKRRAGITKRTNPHSFRHARATELARLGLGEAQLSGLLGWVHGSDMPAVYLHLSGKDIDEALLKAYGLQPKEDINNKRKCPRCFILNDVSVSFCTACGMPITLNAAVETDNKTQELMTKLAPLMELIEDKEVKDFLAIKMVQRQKLI